MPINIRRIVASVGALALVSAGIVFAAAPAHALSFPVTNENDSGDGSLREAMLDAEASAGPDDITFAPGVDSIVLTSPLPVVDHPVRILGPGIDALTIDAPGTVFTIAGGATQIAVTISGMTLTSDEGGADGINSSDADLTVEQVRASHFDEYGIYVTEGSLWLTSAITNNNDVGTFYNSFHTAVITDLTANQNVNSGFSSYSTNSDATSITISGGEFDDNGGWGGSLYFGSGTLTIDGVSATGNQFGWSISAVDGATASISNSTFADNTDYGLRVASQYDGTSVTGSGNTASGNLIGLDLFTTESATIDLVNSVAQNNEQGVQIEASDASAIALRDARVELNGTENEEGGGILVLSADDASTVTIERAVVRSNFGEDGAGIRIIQLSDDADVIVRDSTVSGNTAEFDGAGIQLEQLSGATALLQIIGTDIIGNTAASYGGGMYLDWLGDAVTTGGARIVTSTIAGNTANYGGGIGVNQGLNAEGAFGLVIDSSTVSGNTAIHEGGGLRWIHTEATFGSVRIVNSTFSGNASDFASQMMFDGDAVGETELRLEHSTFTRSEGIGLYLDGTPTLLLSHTVLDDEIGLEIGGPEAGEVTAAYSFVTQPDPAVADMLTGPGMRIGIAPKLGDLAENGGPTLTHLPLTGSPLIDAGDPTFDGPPASDQRGDERIVRVVDVGAVEVAAALAATGSSAPSVPLAVAALLIVLGAAFAGRHLRRADVREGPIVEA